MAATSGNRGCESPTADQGTETDSLQGASIYTE